MANEGLHAAVIQGGKRARRRLRNVAVSFITLAFPLSRCSVVRRCRGEIGEYHQAMEFSIMEHTKECCRCPWPAWCRRGSAFGVTRLLRWMSRCADRQPKRIVWAD